MPVILFVAGIIAGCAALLAVPGLLAFVGVLLGNWWLVAAGVAGAAAVLLALWGRS